MVRLREKTCDTVSTEIASIGLCQPTIQISPYLVSFMCNTVTQKSEVILTRTIPLRGDRQIVLALNDIRIPAAPFPLLSTSPPALANAYAFGTTDDARPYPIDTASFLIKKYLLFLRLCLT